MISLSTQQLSSTGSQLSEQVSKILAKECKSNAILHLRENFRFQSWLVIYFQGIFGSYEFYHENAYHKNEIFEIRPPSPENVFGARKERE